MRIRGTGTPLMDQQFSVNEAGNFFRKDVPKMFGRGTRLLDQKFSVNEAGDFFKKDVPKLFGRGTRLLDQKFSVNEAGDFFKKDVPKLFGRGTRLLDQKFSVNEAGDFFKNDVGKLFGRGIVEVGVSPKQLSKLRNGHRVRVKKPMSGEGVCLIVNPENYSIITRTFSKNKGAEISLSPDEIMDNLNEAPKMEGKGIFGKKFDKFVEDTIGEEAKDVLYKGADLLKKPVKKGIDKLAGLAPEIGASALTAAVLALGQPELVPAAGLLGSKLGKMVGQRGANLAKDYLDRPSYYQEQVGIGGSKRRMSTSMIDELNRTQGTNMGYMERAALGEAQASRQRANMMRQIQEDKFKRLYPNSNISEAEIDQVFDAIPSGEGLYAGTGLYAQSRGRGSCSMRGVGIMNRNSKHLISGQGTRVQPQALMSQPYSANFQFRHTLPPAYQMVGEGLYA